MTCVRLRGLWLAADATAWRKRGIDSLVLAGSGWAWGSRSSDQGAARASTTPSRRAAQGSSRRWRPWPSGADTTARRSRSFGRGAARAKANSIRARCCGHQSSMRPQQTLIRWTAKLDARSRRGSNLAAAEFDAASSRLDILASGGARRDSGKLDSDMAELDLSTTDRATRRQRKTGTRRKGKGGGKASVHAGKEAAAGEGSIGSMETMLPLPNASPHGVYSLDAHKDSTCILEKKS